MRSRLRARRRPTRTVIEATSLAAVLGLTVALLPASAAAADPGQPVSIGTDRAVYPVAEGHRVSIGVRISTSDGAPLAEPQTVDFSVGPDGPVPPDAATAGVDYAATTGSLTFPAGTASGAIRRFTIAAHRDGAAETAESVPVTLSTGSPGATVAAGPAVVINAHGLPYLDARLPVARRVADLLSRMNLTEKIGQMTQAERAAVDADRSLIAQWNLGSLLSGGGSTPTPNTPAAWLAMVNDYQSQAMRGRLQIPLIYGVDAVHGHGNAYGATVFPHNIGLGATRDPALVERIGHATAEEVRATGVTWNFAPCLCVSRDERWGRTYESFSEDPALVVQMTSVIAGLQGRRPDQLNDDDRVLASAKHYAGDGDTEYGTAAGDYRIDQGVTITSRADFARVDLAPYLPAIRGNVGSVMPSFSSVDWTEDGVGNPVKMHAHKELLTDVLKGRLGFDGFLISDWEGIHQIPDPDQPTDGGLTPYKVRTGVNAGTDMFMEPNSAPQFEALLATEVAAGRVGQARIDDAVRRILRKKFALGLFEQPYATADNLDLVGSTGHRALARQAVAESQVLLRNSGGALPLRRDAKLYVAGRNADNIGNQAGGWTITWQGFSGDAIPGSTILDGIRQVAPRAQVTYSEDASAPTAGAEVGVVVVGETPYAEGFGDVGGPRWGWDPADGGVQREPKSLRLRDEDRAVIDKVCSAIDTCVVLVVSGRPQVIGEQLGDIDALVASWLPGTAGEGVADVLFGRRPFTGRLSMTWPASEAQVPVNVGDAGYQPLYPYGWGLHTDPARDRLRAVAATLDDGAARSVRAALADRYWNRDGSPREAAGLLRHLAAAVSAPRGNGSERSRELIVSVARDAAQAAVVAGHAPAGWAALIADADHALATGDAGTAVRLLTRAVGGTAAVKGDHAG